MEINKRNLELFKNDRVIHNMNKEQRQRRDLRKQEKELRGAQYSKDLEKRKELWKELIYKIKKERGAVKRSPERKNE